MLIAGGAAMLNFEEQLPAFFGRNDHNRSCPGIPVAWRLVDLTPPLGSCSGATP
jgi:hypothetical protein